MAGMGSDATVVRRTPRLLKRRLGWFGYAVVALPHLHQTPSEFEIRLDGREPIRRRAHSVVVGNVGILPGGFTLLPGAELDDGLLDIGVLSPEGVVGWAQLGVHLVARHYELADPARRGEVPEFGALEHYRAKYVEISADRPLPCQIDGETIGATPSLVAGVREQVLAVHVPNLS
jgi:diacylglycerol kinase family enzyme